MHDKMPEYLHYPHESNTVALYQYDEREHFDRYWEFVKTGETRHFLDPTPRGIVNEVNYLRRCVEDPNGAVYIIARTTSRDCLGLVMLRDIDSSWNWRAEIGRLVIDPRERQKGLAKETLRTLSHWVFKSLRLRLLYCYVFATNAAALQLFLTFGFEEYGRKPEWSNDGISTTWIEEVEMQLTRKRFEELYHS
jgi:RimJ/RimL family protein N-acetyltransferase